MSQKTKNDFFLKSLTKKIFSVIFTVILQIRHILRHILYSIKINSMGGLSVYRIVAMYLSGLVNGAIAARAESIAYSFFMAVFPSIIFIFSVIAYIPVEGLGETLMEMLSEAMPPHTWSTVSSTVNDIVSIKRGGLLSLSFFAVIFFATNGVNSLIANFKTSYNKILMRSYLNQYLISLNLMLMLMSILIITVGMILASSIFWSNLQGEKLIGIYIPTIILWGKYIMVAMAVLTSVSLIFYFGPKNKKLKFFSPGAIFSTVLIFVSSYVFAFYINHFAQYNKLYGSIGALLIFMFWLFINSFLLLMGFELNAAIVKSMNHIKKRTRQHWYDHLKI